MLKRVRIILTVLLLLATVGVDAQVTTASMAGKVTDASNEPIIGATVQAVHQPSGSRYGTVTNVDGRYSIQGMRTGGPYRVEISYIGYQTVIYKDITLQLGEVYNLNVEMSESSELLNEVIVTAAKTKFTAEKTGATTNISSAQITQLPTVNRSISDIARLSPYANGMSFAGGDGRSTNFTIDGANFNNNFGLSSNLPGGGNPISMDAIEEVQVVVAPFDVRQTNFIGGVIDKSEYFEFRNSYTKTIEGKQDALLRVKKEMKQTVTTGTTERNWVTLFKQYENVEELNRRVLMSLVDRILIHENHAIEIVFKYRDEYQQTIEYVLGYADELDIAV